MDSRPFGPTGNVTGKMTGTEAVKLSQAQTPRPKGRPSPRVPEFHSILQASDTDREWRASPRQPDFYQDINLDQIVAALTSGREEYDLAPFFNTPLTSIAAIHYRQQVFADLENAALLAVITEFAEAMRAQRRARAQVDALYAHFQKELWFLDSVDIYTTALSAVTQALGPLKLKSSGFVRLRAALVNTVKSQAFKQLVADITTLKAALADVEYIIQIKLDKVTVRKPIGEVDYGAQIEKTFERFKRKAAKNYLISFPENVRMNSVEERVLALVARLYPKTFERLDTFSVRHAEFIEPFIARYDREIQFYLAMIEKIAYLRHAGLSFCRPVVSTTDKAIFNRDGFDLALALKLVAEGKSVVCNDFALTGAERIIVVSGPNQGGKTTFARSFGQLFCLAALGLPVPGSAAHIFLFDQMFAQFERVEYVTNLRSKLENDLRRVYAILHRATPQSVIILNEIFSSTTLLDQGFLSAKVFEQLISLDALCLCVTFLDELSRQGETTVSMVSTIVPEDPSTRTFKIERRPSDGLAYALAVAEKYRLTYEQLTERLAP